MRYNWDRTNEIHRNGPRSDPAIVVSNPHGSSMRVAIIGAGPAGLTAALQLARGGAEVTVFEAGDCVGGLARSLDLWGQRVDLGPHRFFSTDQRVNQLWLEVVGNDYAMVDRLTRVYYRGRFFHYPLKPLNALWNMGFANATLSLGSYLKQQLRPTRPTNEQSSFEDWIVRRFGRRLYEMFFKSYSEKLWGTSCSQISADFAAQRIKKFSLREALFSAFSARRRTRHETLLDQFAYPLAGTGSVYEKMAEQIRSLGGKVCLQCPVKRVVHDDLQVTGVELVVGRQETFDRVVSTMPLTALVRGLDDVPQAVQESVDHLRFRNTILVYLHVASEELFDDQWLYIQDPTLKMGRVTNFRNWVNELYGEQSGSILAVELWCNDEDSDWTAPDGELIEQAITELRSTRLLSNEEVAAGHVVRVPRSYPVYLRGYEQHTETIINHLRKFNGLDLIGRYGAFKYINQDNSILMGILAAERILDDKSHDLWSVNAENDTYQESALISETGLVR